MFSRVFGKKEADLPVSAANLPKNHRKPSNFSQKSVSGYESAVVDRLSADFLGSYSSENALLSYTLPRLRARSRELVRNNGYVQTAISSIVNNVVGTGFTLNARIPLKGNISKDPDTKANEALEKLWWEWGKPYNCSTDGYYSFSALCRAVVFSLLQDGEALLIRRRGNNFGKFGYQLQLLDSDFIADSINTELPNGNRIINGVEIDEYGKAVFYHLYKYHPGERLIQVAQGGITSVPAADVLHVFKRTRPGTTRGTPITTPTMILSHHLQSYTKSEVINSIVSASKSAFISRTENSSDEFVGTTNADGSMYEECEEISAGSVQYLNPGESLQSFIPNSPNGNYADFLKAILRGICSSLGANYSVVSGDYESVNYSSLRHALLNDRDAYTIFQEFLCSTLLYPIFNDFLYMASLTGHIKPRDIERFSENVDFRGRQYSLIDPLKETAGKEKEVSNLFTSRTEVCRQSGLEFEKVVADLAKEKEIMESYGVSMSDLAQPAQGPLHPNEILAQPDDDDGMMPAKPNGSGAPIKH
jgi:lambda family phage portal protein